MHRSQKIGLEMGKLSSIPITDKISPKLASEEIENPFALIDSIRVQRFKDHQRGFKFPQKKIFGGDTPDSVAFVTPFDEHHYT